MILKFGKQFNLYKNYNETQKGSCQMKIATLNKGKETKYFNGYPLIEEEDIYSQDHLKEGDIFQIVTDKSQYVATAYVGRQHKGLGWVLTYDKAQEINTAL